LLDQAVQQGLVGENMKNVHERILNVLLAIGDALGAKIPDALRGLPAVAEEAAAGMNDALGKVKMPNLSVEVPEGEPRMYTPEGYAHPSEMPEFHNGGLLWRRMHSGGLAGDEVPIIGQSGEFMMSRRGVATAGLSNLQRLNRGQSAGGGGAVVVNLTVNGSLIHEDELSDTIARLVAPKLPGAVKEYGLA
jgi:hypothetical protein